MFERTNNWCNRLRWVQALLDRVKATTHMSVHSVKEHIITATQTQIVSQTSSYCKGCCRTGKNKHLTEANMTKIIIIESKHNRAA